MASLDAEPGGTPAFRPVQPRMQWLRVHFALIMREMTTTYARNSGGYLWAVADPLGQIILLAFVFSLMIRTPSLGNSFILFYATGVLPFQMYSQIANNVGNAVRFNRSLMQYPAVTPLDAVLARVVLNVLTLTLVSTLLLWGVIYFQDLSINLNLAAIIIAYVMAISMGVGIGACNSVLVAFFPTWDRIWIILTRPLFILSGIIYIPEELPSQIRQYLLWNPFIHIPVQMRVGIYGAFRPDYLSPAYVFGIALPLCLIGLHQLRRHRSALINPRV